MFMFDLFFKALNDEWEDFLALFKDRAHLIKCETYHNTGSTRAFPLLHGYMRTDASYNSVSAGQQHL